ncbi:glycosyltransferase [Chryseobacterium sp. TY4]
MEISKKILIISYYWPPAGGPGVQRWLKFAKYLPEFGWEPIIYTPENPSYPIVDETLLKDVPENIKIVRTKIWEPYQLAEKFSKGNKKYKAGQFDVGKNQSFMSKLSIFVRGNFFIPDARKFWVKPSISFLKNYLKEHNIDVIVTTGPPHSLHLIGFGLKKEIPNLKWIADFRDPWTEISYYKHLKLTKSSDQKHRDLEKSVFENADLTLATSYTDAENFRKMGANSVCITNGFDTSSFEEADLSKSNKEKFCLGYVGVLEQLRNPENLWKAIHELLEENLDFENDFEMKFVGRLDDKILENLKASKIGKHLQILGYRAHAESYQEMKNSDLLLITNFPNNSSKGIIPGKLFEYLSTRKPILSFGPKEADVSKILNETKAGKHFDYTEIDSLKSYILQIYQLWKSGNNTSENANIETFSRRTLTKDLAEKLDILVTK